MGGNSNSKPNNPAPPPNKQRPATQIADDSPSNAKRQREGPFEEREAFKQNGFNGDAPQRETQRRSVPPQIYTNGGDSSAPESAAATQVNLRQPAVKDGVSSTCLQSMSLWMPFTETVDNYSCWNVNVDAPNGEAVASAPADSSGALRPKWSFHCQLAHGSPTGIIAAFDNVKQLYEKIAQCYEIDPSTVRSLARSHIWCHVFALE